MLSHKKVFFNVNMCFGPNFDLVQRTIDINYEKRKRAASMKWFLVNAAVFLVFTYDLTCTGGCPATAARAAELVLAGAACACALRHGARLLVRRAPPPARLSRRQLRLLGLAEADLDSSLVLSESSETEAGGECVADHELSAADTQLSLSPLRWRGAAPPSPPSPAAPQHARPAPALDRFIADRRSLSDYLQQHEAQQAVQQEAQRATGAGCARGPPPTYQLSAVDAEGGKREEGSPQRAPEACWQLDVDPHKLTQWNLNLRLWIHITILERLVEGMAAADAALARLAGGEAQLGRLGGERLRALSGTIPALGALLPYLEPFADQRYVVRRIRDLARAPCLSSYRWNGGGADWEDSLPTDAEIILHLFATYLDGQMLQSGNPRPFSSQYLGGGGELSLQRVSERPPQWAVSARGALGSAAPGRNNLLHALLLLLAAAARRDPPALARTPLGPSGLNMLWILS
ncbi:transmembrane protein 209 isoform X2 [Battus philenor]|uniref:transmembrane protein 209 isoform X2 n=1 Tax=Battus philenor TaxID=42288 RepID=UPI0035CFF037